MKVNQLKRLYETNGIINYILKTENDLLKIHGIDVTDINGYSTLNKIDKEDFKRFIIEFLNGWGLDTRASIYPKKVCKVNENNYVYLRFDYYREDTDHTNWVHVIKSGFEWY